MPRIPCFYEKRSPYHVVSWTALSGLPFADTDKEYLLELMKK